MGARCLSSYGGQIEHAITSISVDNYAGMYAAVKHLIEVHDRKRIAFIKGPPGNNEANVRLAAYTDALQAHGLPFDPE